jgi:NitT/TauT family transport system ATP-binding protein
MSGTIEIQHVGKVFPLRGAAGKAGGVFTALDDISLDVRAGEFLSVVGPSGCGKSSLLDILAGLVRPDSGRVLIDGAEVLGPSPDRAVVFQQYALLPWRSALRNVEFGLEAKGVGARARRETARRFLDLVGLAGFENHYPHELSGGMKQRVAIARSLACDPAVLLMDEPFAALDAQTREILQDELLRIWEAAGTTIVFITHGIDEAVYLGQRVAVMSSRPGRIKTVIDVPKPDRHDPDADTRSTPEFVALRHQVWDLLHDEYRKADAQERVAVAAAR